MSSLVRMLTAGAVAMALVAVPTGSMAAAPVALPQPTAQQAGAAASVNPWLTLSAMSSSSSNAATAAAAQGEGEGGPGFPPIAPLAVILGTIALAIWILAHDDDGDIDFIEEPVSP
jgi:hypothetical protein